MGKGKRPNHRVVSGLKWARPLEEKEWPRGIPKRNRLRGSKQDGLAFEKAVHKALLIESYFPMKSKWFEYEDDNGHGYCQTDLIIPPFIIECKLSDAINGRLQLSELYIPVIKLALGIPKPKGIVCIKHMTEKVKASQVCRNLSFAMRLAEGGMEIPILFYLGKGPI